MRFTILFGSHCLCLKRETHFNMVGLHQTSALHGSPSFIRFAEWCVWFQAFQFHVFLFASVSRYDRLNCIVAPKSKTNYIHKKTCATSNAVESTRVWMYVCVETVDQKMTHSMLITGDELTASEWLRSGSIYNLTESHFIFVETKESFQHLLLSCLLAHSLVRSLAVASP